MDKLPLHALRASPWCWSLAACELALRLARVKRCRDDKRADDADILERVRRVYARSVGRVIALLVV